MWACGFVLALLTLSCASKSKPQPTHRTLTVLLLPRQVPLFSGALAKAFSAELPGVDIKFIQKEGSTDYEKDLQAGDVDIAFVLADTAYLAFVGQLDGRRYDRLRGIAALDPYPLFLIVRGNSSVRDVEELRGQRVNAGAPGTVTGDIAIKALEIKAVVSHYGFETAAAKLSAGTLDAMFVVGNFPRNRIRDLLRQGARILPMSQASIARLHRNYPFMRGMVIPSAEFGNGPMLTIALDRLVICRAGLDEDLEYGVTKAHFQSLPDLSTLDTALRQMNAEDAPATPIPLHEGAARYYREQAANE